MRERLAFPTLLAATVATLFAAQTANAQPVLITFDSLGGGSAVLAQFAGQGVTFNQLLVRDYSDTRFFGTGFAHSGTKGVEQCFAQEFCTVPVGATFTTPQSRVKVWVGYSVAVFANLTVELVAFGSSGQVITQASTVFAMQPTVRPINTPIEVIAASQSITRIELRARVTGAPETFSGSLAVDDFEFDTAGPPPPCSATTAPRIIVSSPPFSSTTQVNSYIFSGSVSTQTPLIEASVTVTGPGGTGYTADLLARNSIPLPGGTFGPTRFSPLFPGRNEITVRAANCFGERSDTRSIVYAPPLGGSRIVLEHIEVNQAIQELDNLGNQRVELIADKRTVARVYLRTASPPGGTIFSVRGTLIGLLPDGTLPGGPTNVRSANSISVGPNPALGPRQNSIDGTLNFVLPPEWTRAGGLHLAISSLTVEGVSNVVPCENCANRNEFSLDRIVRFNAAPPLRVVLFSVPNTTGGSTFVPRELDLAMLESWLARAYPTGRVLSSRRQLDAFTGVPDTDFEAADVNARLHALRCLCPPGFTDCSDSRVHWYGMVSDQGGFLRGRARGIPGTIASGPAGSGSFGWDNDGTYADWYGGHELAHSYSRRHPGFCGESNDDDSYPYVGGLIVKSGFDVGDPAQSTSMAVQPGGQFADVMTYCDFQWISDYTYRGILSYLRQIEGSGAGAGDARIADAILIQGDVNLTRRSATLRPFLRLSDLPASEAPAASTFAIELRGAADAMLARHLVRLDEDTEREPGDDLLASFDLVAPWVDGTRRIVLLDGARELASRTVSANAPVVRLLFPNGPIAPPPNGIITVRWSASDADGDPLSFALLYSTDDGETWEPLDAGLSATSRDVPLAALRGAERARLRVVASDGVLTSTDDQDAPMRIAGKVPEPRIASPGDGERIDGDGVLILRGESFDLEDGHLDGDALVWLLDDEQVLGTGPSTSLPAGGLPPGAHVVTLEATDSSGAVGISSVRVEIGAVPVVAHASAASPVAPGTTVQLDAAGSSGVGALSFVWTLVARPARSTAAIVGPSGRVATLRPDRAGTYVVELRVGDSRRLAASAFVAIEAAVGTAFLRGEVTGDGTIDISDATRILNWLFLGAAAPGCADAADTNDDGVADISDGVGLLNYLFLGGAEPALPFPGCGLDPTIDALDCASSSCR